MKKVTIICCVFLFVVSAFAQTTPVKASLILGNNFVAQSEVVSAWGTLIKSPLLTSELVIPYSDELLEKCAESNRLGETNFYLLPLVGLSKKQLSAYWNFFTTDIILINSKGAWRLINFQTNQELSFSWSKERAAAAQLGMSTLPALEYFELSASLYLARRVDVSKNFSEFYFSKESIDSNRSSFNLDDQTIIFGTNLSRREALVIEFPKENFLPGFLKPSGFSYLVFGEGEEANEFYVIEFTKPLCSFEPKKDYEISSIRYLPGKL